MELDSSDDDFDQIDLPTNSNIPSASEVENDENCLQVFEENSDSNDFDDKESRHECDLEGMFSSTLFFSRRRNRKMFVNLLQEL